MVVVAWRRPTVVVMRRRRPAVVLIALPMVVGTLRQCGGRSGGSEQTGGEDRDGTLQKQRLEDIA